MRSASVCRAEVTHGSPLAYYLLAGERPLEASRPAGPRRETSWRTPRHFRARPRARDSQGGSEGPPPALICPVGPMHRVNTEWLALSAGLKPGLRLAVDISMAKEVLERYRSGGFVVAVSRAHVGIEQRERILLYVAKRINVAAGLRAAERPILDPNTSLRHKGIFTRELGLRLGYPRCCVEAFATRTERGGGRFDLHGHERFDPDYVHVHEAYVDKPDWRVNNLLMRQFASLISFAPCRFDCPFAVAQAAAIESLVREQARPAAPSLEAMLRRPLAIHSSGARAWVRLSGGLVTEALAPHEMPNGPAEARDVAVAAAWRGSLAKGGRLTDHDKPPPIVLDFAFDRAGGVVAGQVQ